MSEDLKTAAREAVDAADAYLRGALGPIELHQTASRIGVPLTDDQREARLCESLWFLLTAMERTSERSGTHEVRWRNAMHAMAMVVRMDLGEGLHPEDSPRDEIAEINRASMARARQSDELALLLTVARVLRATLREMAPNAEGAACSAGDDIAALNDALAPFDPRPGEPINEAAPAKAKSNGRGLPSHVSEKIADHMFAIQTLFKPGMKITLLIRSPEHPDGSRDRLMTDDLIDEAVEAMLRRKREGVAK